MNADACTWQMQQAGRIGKRDWCADRHGSRICSAANQVEHRHLSALQPSAEIMQLRRFTCGLLPLGAIPAQGDYAVSGVGPTLGGGIYCRAARSLAARIASRYSSCFALQSITKRRAGSLYNVEMAGKD